MNSTRINRWRATFADDSDEHDFREQGLADQRRSGVTVAAVVMVLPTLNLLAEIPRMLHGDEGLGEIALLRILVVAVSAAMIVFLLRTASQRAVANVLTVYGLFVVAATVLIVCFHPTIGVMAPTSTVAILTLIYFFAPLHFTRVVLLAALISVGGWFGWVVVRGGQTGTDAFRLILWLASVNLVGFFGCNASNRTMRALFWERRELARQKALAEAAYQRERVALGQFKQFAQLISHEFRNPLAVVKSKVQLMQLIAALDKADDPEALPAIERAVNRLDTLFSQWLASDRVAEGDMTLDVRRIGLAELLRTVEREAPVSDKHPIVFDPVASDLGTEADPVLLRLVLTNLLENAVKYSPKGGAIRVSALREGAQVVIRVRDHGMGIAPERLDRVFDKYYRESHDNGIRGFGLGLFLVKRTMESHGGSVSIESGLGEGTTVILKMPVDPGSAMSEFVVGAHS
ncbi:MAG: HAMP domain-containing histidine kinase [Alphaproteobacteria bacterium]|nr:HAMP domain-containing histidine kinase [Alphaproteobacteria bacterium]